MAGIKVVIDIIEKEGDLHEFFITHDAHIFRINCFLYKLEDTLLLTSVDVEGPGSGLVGRVISDVISNICDEFCNKFGTERVIILGAKRTAGKTKGSFFRPIYRKKKND